MGLEFSLKHMEVDMREPLLILLKVVKELNFFKMEIFTKDLIYRESFMDLDNIIGKMEVITRGTLIREFEVDMEFGKRERAFAINTKVNLRITKKMAMVFIHGGVAIYIKEAIKIICEMDMDRCTGKMELFTKDNGS
jgi:hypothetical protein